MSTRAAAAMAYTDTIREDIERAGYRDAGDLVAQLLHRLMARLETDPVADLFARLRQEVQPVRADPEELPEPDWAQEAIAQEEWEELRSTFVRVLAYQGEPWREHAACKGSTAVMFPERGASNERAKAMCASCKVLDACEAWIMDPMTPSEESGIIAGMSARERKRRSKGLRAVGANNGYSRKVAS